MRLMRYFIAVFVFVMILFITSFLHFTSNLPNVKTLLEYRPSTVTRLYTKTGLLVAEYAKEKRIFTPYTQIPSLITNAFLAAEDHNFFTHSGVNIYSVLRAGLQSITKLSQNKKAIGGSTITQQLVKTLLLDNKRDISRKIKEAVLAYRISTLYSKEQISKVKNFAVAVLSYQCDIQLVYAFFETLMNRVVSRRNLDNFTVNNELQII